MNARRPDKKITRCVYRNWSVSVIREVDRRAREDGND